MILHLYRLWTRADNKSWEKCEHGYYHVLATCLNILKQKIGWNVFFRTLDSSIALTITCCTVQSVFCLCLEDHWWSLKILQVVLSFNSTTSPQMLPNFERCSWFSQCFWLKSFKILAFSFTFLQEISLKFHNISDSRATFSWKLDILENIDHFNFKSTFNFEVSMGTTKKSHACKATHIKEIIGNHYLHVIMLGPELILS